MSLLEIVKLAQNYEKAKSGITRKQSHINRQKANMHQKKENRKIGALLLACIIEADLPEGFFEVLRKSNQLEKIMRSFSGASAESKALLNELFEDFVVKNEDDDEVFGRLENVNVVESIV